MNLKEKKGTALLSFEYVNCFIWITNIFICRLFLNLQIYYRYSCIVCSFFWFYVFWKAVLCVFLVIVTIWLSRIYVHLYTFCCTEYWNLDDTHQKSVTHRRAKLTSHEYDIGFRKFMILLLGRQASRSATHRLCGRNINKNPR